MSKWDRVCSASQGSPRPSGLPKLSHHPVHATSPPPHLIPTLPHPSHSPPLPLRITLPFRLHLTCPPHFQTPRTLPTLPPQEEPFKAWPVASMQPTLHRGTSVFLLYTSEPMLRRHRRETEAQNICPKPLLMSRGAHGSPSQLGSGWTVPSGWSPRPSDGVWPGPAQDMGPALSLSLQHPHGTAPSLPRVTPSRVTAYVWEA